MERTSIPMLHPALLPAGTVLGRWRVVAWGGQGVHGAVYRAVRVGQEQAPAVALKLRYGDGRALLTDFGACHFPGASALTPPGTHPGTPLYRAPESWSRVLNRQLPAHALAHQADDLFALGVTACRLVTGEYPELSEPRRDEHGLWHVDSVVPPQALLKEEHLSPRLRASILRMLSMRPEERGTAEQLAEALEQDAAPGLEDTPPPRVVRASSSTRAPEAPATAAPRRTGSTRSARPWLALAAAVLAGAVGAWRMEIRRTADGPLLAQAATAAASRSSVGTAGLGDALTSLSAAASLQEPKGIAEDTLPAPLPDQLRPDSQGRCPHKRQVALNEGCWQETSMGKEECEATASIGHMAIMFKNKCYLPVLRHGRQPSSSPSAAS